MAANGIFGVGFIRYPRDNGWNGFSYYSYNVNLGFGETLGTRRGLVSFYKLFARKGR